MNIPPQRGDVAVHDPNNQTVRQVVHEAVRALIEEYPLKEQYQVVLPKGMLPEHAGPLVASLGEPVTLAGQDLKQGQPVLDASKVRVRGWIAQVDAIRSTKYQQPEDQRQLISVNLKWNPLDGWRSETIRPWRMDADEALKQISHSELGATPSADR